jgi:hypothetical protein
MPKPGKTDLGIKDSTTRTAPQASHHPSLVAVPRVWLYLLAALVVLPWLVGSGVFLWVSRQAPSVAAAPGATSDQSSESARGPWGHLVLTPIVISPPLEYVAADWGRPESATTWHFPDTTREVLQAFLSSAGLQPEQSARLLATALSDPTNHGLIVTPDPALVRSMDSETRRRIYNELAKTPLNPDHQDSFQFHGSSVEAWLGGSLISPRTRQLIEPLIYRDGEYLNFSDVATIRSEVTDVEEQRRLAKVLLRQATVLVRLVIDDPSEVPALAEYWGRGGRRTDLRPLLESVAARDSDRSIDIVHLFPPFAREHLYRFPKLTVADLNKPQLVNCLWTALNFFATFPNDQFLQMDAALSHLQRDYFLVERDFELGDIVAFVDEKGNIFHLAVFLADDLVFSKNGISPVTPWAIQTISELKAYYRSRCPNPRLMYHRRTDF